MSTQLCLNDSERMMFIQIKVKRDFAEADRNPAT